MRPKKSVLFSKVIFSLSRAVSSTSNLCGTRKGKKKKTKPQQNRAGGHPHVGVNLFQQQQSAPRHL